MEGTDERGFTLIETCIALVVMMVMALSVASLFAYAVNYNSGAHDRALAQAIAQQRMERLRKTSFYSLASSTETVASDGRTFNITITVSNDASLKTITVSVTPQGNSSWGNGSVTIITQRATPDAGAYLT